MQAFFARIDANGSSKQLLSGHLNNVADLSSVFSNYKNISKLIGILHDFGKATSEFQNYLIHGGPRGSVVHAVQGALFADDCASDSNDMACTLTKEIAALTITAHHGSLSDGISPSGDDVFVQKLAEKDNGKYNYWEAKQNIAGLSPELVCDIDDLFRAAQNDTKSILDLIVSTYKSRKSANKSAQFALGLFVKYIYSCLVDADRLDAYLFDIDERYRATTVNWDGLIGIFEDNISKFSDETKIAKIRQSVSNLCKDAATKNTGIYQLSVPTGGGKTLSSLRFALHHCKKENKQRIIYVIPYLSIVEQTALELRKIFNLQGDTDILLEHHSNIVLPDDEDEQKTRKLATSRWDNPIVITTMVQFLETVISARASDLRKFHHMSDSVIIFDEIQSLPIKAVHLFNEVVSFLAKICNTTILLCTATQPRLSQTERENLLLESSPNLIDVSGMFDDIHRTTIVAEEEKDFDAFANFVAEKARGNGDCLAIVNTKKSALAIFERLKDEHGFKVYHLSTSMCSAHRAETIARVKKALSCDEKIICVTTQLIEAGVDISFSCVIRAAAGLDSVMQAAGRCNRNGESDTPKEVYVVPLRGENLDELADIKCGKEITERLIRENRGIDLSGHVMMEQFYKYYFYSRKDQMDYRIKDDNDKTIYDMLSGNKDGQNSYHNKTGGSIPCVIAHAFRAASDNFEVIDKGTVSVVVLYGDAVKLVAIYDKQPKIKMTKEKIDTIRKLEKFSVALYPWEMNKMAGAISFLDKDAGIMVLDRRHYSDDVGVVAEVDPANYIV